MLGEPRDGPTACGTHPPAAERQTLRDDVDAKNLENLLRRQRFLGGILGVGRAERRVLRRTRRRLLPADGSWHLSPGAG